jgi:hypothetical protein
MLVVDYLGMQDAPHKWRAPSKTLGAWAGSIVTTDESGVSVSVSQERWDKTKQILLDMAEILERNNPELSHKQLFSNQGFLIYVARAYPTMIPYLKGVHLTIEHWQNDRDEEGRVDQDALKVRHRRTDKQILEEFEDWLNMASILRMISKKGTTLSLLLRRFCLFLG